MSVSIVVGGQFGSEGKGKVARFFARELGSAAVVRVGGANSGHIVVDSSLGEFAFRMLPTAAIDHGSDCVLPVGSYIDIDVLMREIEWSGIDPSRVKVDPGAVVVSNEMRLAEGKSICLNSIGSTCCGVGAAVTARITRDRKRLSFARDSELLRPFLVDTKDYLRTMLDRDESVLIEGTQGYGLSLLHGPYYPYVTSRDTTAAGFLSEVGLSPIDVENVIMVLRAFPIRVGGDSGPLPNETDWKTIARQGGAGEDLQELTTVTKRRRRVAFFDSEVVREAIVCNAPNIIVLNHIDYFDHSIYGQKQLNDSVEERIVSIEYQIGRRIDYVGNSRETVLLR